jgi:hypothetical protein
MSIRKPSQAMLLKDAARTILKPSCLFLFASSLIAQAGSPSFQNDIRPILMSHCAACHSVSVRQGGLSIEARESLLAGGKSGPAILPGRPSDSLLLTMVASGVMPKVGPKLTPEQIETIRRWIESPDPGGADSPVAATAPPEVSERDVIMPILGAKCFVCHGRHVQKGSLDLRTVAGMLKGGKSGPAIVPGKPG